LRALALIVIAAAALGAAPPAQDSAPPGPPPEPAPSLARLRRVTTRYDDYFRKYSKRYFGPTFDWRLFKAQAMAESNLVPTAHSRAGAHGLMQLMPSTYAQIASTRPNYQAIDDPQWNIAAGILHDRGLWTIFAGRSKEEDRTRFMFGGYNAGDFTIERAQGVARRAQLDPRDWDSIIVVAPRVPHWRYRETLGYVNEIEDNYAFLRPAPHAVIGN
jgi:soluble lytic murein transglycosylase-like protein